jgi:hypothetical protein
MTPDPPIILAKRWDVFIMRYDQILSFNKPVNSSPRIHYYPVCRLNNMNLKSLIGHVIAPACVVNL